MEFIKDFIIILVNLVLIAQFESLNHRDQAIRRKKWLFCYFWSFDLLDLSSNFYICSMTKKQRINELLRFN